MVRSGPERPERPEPGLYADKLYCTFRVKLCLAFGSIPFVAVKVIW